MNLHLDDPQIGISPETSHPNYIGHITEAFYWDIKDEFSPFGNDDGGDTLYYLEEWIRYTKGEQPVVYFLEEMWDRWGLDEVDWELLDAETLHQNNENAPFRYDLIDRTTIATAFGESKITGQITPDILEVALLSIERQSRLAKIEQELLNINPQKQFKLAGAEPKNDLPFESLHTLYLKRLQQMKNDLNMLGRYGK